MALVKIVFIIPGFRHKSTSKQYKNVAKILKKEGYIPVAIAIPWKKSTILQNTSFFLNEYKKHISLEKYKNKRKKTYILGFSFGALIALIAATKIRVSGLVLCSLSPFFKEDLSTKEKVKSTEFTKLHSRKLAKQIKTKQVHMLYGEKEAKKLIRRAKKAFGYFTGVEKYLIPIQAVSHDIGHSRYLQKIHTTATMLR